MIQNMANNLRLCILGGIKFISTSRSPPPPPVSGSRLYGVPASGTQPHAAMFLSQLLLVLSWSELVESVIFQLLNSITY
jgi:hypothetical protein